MVVAPDGGKTRQPNGLAGERLANAEPHSETGGYLTVDRNKRR
jgi:hypothetical protein